MAFDFDEYKTQCLSVADAFKASGMNADDVEYKDTVRKAEKLSKAVVAKIELEIIVKGKQFRPIDAYQFADEPVSCAKLVIA